MSNVNKMLRHTLIARFKSDPERKEKTLKGTYEAPGTKSLIGLIRDTREVSEMSSVLYPASEVILGFRGTPILGFHTICTDLESRTFSVRMFDMTRLIRNLKERAAWTKALRAFLAESNAEVA